MIFFTMLFAAVTIASSDCDATSTCSTRSSPMTSPRSDITELSETQQKVRGWPRIKKMLLPSDAGQYSRPVLHMKHANENDLKNAEFDKAYRYLLEKINPHGKRTEWYMNEADRKEHEITFDENGFVNSSGSFKTIDEGQQNHKGYSGPLIFVQGLDEKLYAAKKIRKWVQHSSFFAGETVLNAGMMFLENGKLKAIAWQSGHYVKVKNTYRKFATSMVKHLQKCFGIDPSTFLVADRHIFHDDSVKFKLLRASEFLEDSEPQPATYENKQDFFEPEHEENFKKEIEEKLTAFRKL